jgi:hypothetical protein
MIRNDHNTFRPKADLDILAGTYVHADIRSIGMGNLDSHRPNCNPQMVESAARPLLDDTGCQQVMAGKAG